MSTHHNQPMPLNLKSLKTRFAFRFIKALKKINQQQETTSSDKLMVTRRYHLIKVAADASLASAVGPKRAWSRAILRRIRLNSTRSNALARRKIARRKRQRGSVQVEGQAEELRRLVPGGEAMDLQSLLYETLHYVKCLATQVNVMRSIVDLCSIS